MNDIYELELEMKPMCDIKCKLIDAVKEEFGKGTENVRTAEMGEVIDMIKDIAEAEKDCYKALYYKTVTEAMGDASEERYGYTKRIYRPYGDRDPYLDEYLHNGDDPYSHNFKMGYTFPKEKYMDRIGDARYGKAYNDYKMARRSYTTTNDTMAKDEMNAHALEHVSDTIATMRDIWKSADPDLKKRIKSDFTNLLSEMTI